MITRRKTRQIRLGNVKIGGDAPLTVQSMTKTDTRDVQATLLEIWALEAAGCDIVRCAVPVREAAEKLGEIKRQIRIPLVADIHFNYKLALIALEQGVDGLRLNPGNIGGKPFVQEVVNVAKEKQIPVRIGVNAGSLEKDLLAKHGGPTAEGMVESALRHIRILEDCNYPEMKISLKASDPRMMIEAYRMLADQVDYPFHLGVTEEIQIGVMGCVPEGQSVVTRQGPKPIETVSETDEVLTHAGEYRKVEWASTHAFDGELVEIQPTGFTRLRLTENHPVWAFPRPMRLKAGRERRPHVQAALDAGVELRWVPAGELRPGWVLAYPVVQEKEDRATIAADGLGEIPVDEDFMTLAGYYLSEGTMSGKAGKPYQQFFYFHEDQRAYVERLQSILSGMGLASQVRRRRHTAEVVAHSLALGQLLKALFGHGATEKRMPDWMERLPHEKQRALVKALWEGDGYLGRVRGYWRATYCTSSHALAVQVHQLLLRLGVTAFLHHRDQRARQRNWVVSVTAQAGLGRLAQILQLGARSGCRDNAKGQVVLTETMLYVGGRAVRRVAWKGHVHNLEVDGAHSFALPGAMLHNCEVNGPGEARAADIGVAGGRGIGLIFKNGEVIRKVAEKDIVKAMREEVDRFVAERKAARATAPADD